MISLLFDESLLLIMNESFFLEQRSFLSLLNAMQPICTKRTTVDATSCLYIHVEPYEVIVKATDLEIALQASYPIKSSSVSTQLTFLVSGKRLFDVIKEFHESVECIFTGTQLLLKSESACVTLLAKDYQEFPTFPEKIENLMNLKAEDLLSMISYVAFLVPQNNVNLSLNGLLFEVSPDCTILTTTDGHCLAQIRNTKYRLNITTKWLMPRRAIFELKKILENTEPQEDIFLGTCKNQLVFSGKTFNFFTRLLHDTFPAYHSLLNMDNFTSVNIDRLQMLKTLRRSVCLLSGQFVATKFSFLSDRIAIEMQNQDVGSLKEEIMISEYSGTEMNIRFYAPYLLSGLQVIMDETVQIFLQNPSKPLIFKSIQENVEFTYLVMPVAPQHHV